MPVRIIHTNLFNTTISDRYDKRTAPIPVNYRYSFKCVDYICCSCTDYTNKIAPLSNHCRERRSTNKHSIPNITLEFDAKDNKIVIKVIKVIKSSKKLKQVSRALQDATIEQTDDQSCILLHFKHVISGIKGFSITVRESTNELNYPIEPLSFQFEKNIATLKSRQGEDKDYFIMRGREIPVSIPSIFTYNSDHPSKSVLGLMERYLSKSITKEDPSIANPKQTHIPVPPEWLSLSRHVEAKEYNPNTRFVESIGGYNPNIFSAGCRPIMLFHSSQATTVEPQSIEDFVGWLLEFPSKIAPTEPIICHRRVSVSVIMAP